MFDELLNLVKQNGQGAIVQNNAIPNEHNESAMQDATSSITDVLKNQVSGGKLQDLMGMFQSGQLSNLTNHPIVKQIIDKFSGNLQSNYGVKAEDANQSSAALIPGVLKQFVDKTNDPNDNSFNLQNIMSQFAGEDGKLGLDDLKGITGKFGF